MTLSHLVKYPATAAEHEENKGAGVIACTEAKLRPFNSILIFKMRPTAFQQLQANEDFSNTRGRANLCVSICTDEAHVACLHHWQGRHSRPCLRQCPRKINSSTRLVKATVLGVRQNRYEMTWTDWLTSSARYPAKLKRMPGWGAMEGSKHNCHPWSLDPSWSSWQSQKTISVSLPRSIQISTMLYLSTSSAVSICFNATPLEIWEDLAWYLLLSEEPKAQAAQAHWIPLSKFKAAR